MSNYIYGKNSFIEALKNNRIKKAYVLSGSPFIDELKRKHIEFEISERNILDKMTKSGNHQGAVAEVEEFKLSELKDLYKKENGFIVILDGIEDPHNLGAIIRTCECAGVDGVIYKKHHSVKVNDTVAKVACGALEYVKVVEVTNISNTIDELKDNGYWIVGSDGLANDYYDDLKYDTNIALIIGSEGKGMGRLVKEKCDYMVKLPMKGKVTSLNASVAAGILIYGVLSKRK